MSNVHWCFSLTVSKLRSSVLDVRGVFSLLNALRCIRPGDKHTLVLAFSPCLEEKVGKQHEFIKIILVIVWMLSEYLTRSPTAVLQYCETLEVRSQKMTLRMTLCGEGVVPAVTCSHPGGVLDFGYVLESESITQVFKVSHQCTDGERTRRRSTRTRSWRCFCFLQIQDWKRMLTVDSGWLPGCYWGGCR